MPNIKATAAGTLNAEFLIMETGSLFVFTDIG